MNTPFGHVAVITNVSENYNFVEIAEQNYYNEKWVSEEYSRRLKMIKDDNEKFYIFDEEYKEKQNNDKNSLKEKIVDDDVRSVIGWKRIGNALN